MARRSAARQQAPPVPAHANGLAPWRRVYIVGGAILTLIGIATAAIALWHFVYGNTVIQAANDAAAAANVPVLKQLDQIQADQHVTRRQIATLARAVNEPNPIKRAMLVEQVQQMNEDEPSK